MRTAEEDRFLPRQASRAPGRRMGLSAGREGKRVCPIAPSDNCGASAPCFAKASQDKRSFDGCRVYGLIRVSPPLAGQDPRLPRRLAGLSVGRLFFQSSR